MLCKGLSLSYRALLRSLNWGEALALDIFRDGARFHELQQVIGATGFGTDAGEFEAAKRLPFDDRSRDAAIDIEVAHFKVPFCPVDVGRRAGVEAAGQGVASTVGDG